MYKQVQQQTHTKNSSNILAQLLHYLFNINRLKQHFKKLNLKIMKYCI
jgi:hypothetical protein